MSERRRREVDAVRTHAVRGLARKKQSGHQRTSGVFLTFHCVLLCDCEAVPKPCEQLCCLRLRYARYNQLLKFDKEIRRRLLQTTRMTTQAEHDADILTFIEDVEKDRLTGDDLKLSYFQNISYANIERSSRRVRTKLRDYLHNHGTDCGNPPTSRLR